MNINTEKNIYDNLSDEDAFYLENIIKTNQFNLLNDLIHLQPILFTESIKQIIERSLYHYYKNKVLEKNKNDNQTNEYYNVCIYDHKFLELNNCNRFDFKSYESCLNFIKNLKPNVAYIENTIKKIDNYNKIHKEIIDYKNCDIKYIRNNKSYNSLPKHTYKFDRIEFTDIVSDKYNKNESNLEINIFMQYLGSQVWKELDLIEQNDQIFSREVKREKIVQDWIVMENPVNKINIKISKKILEFKD